MSQKHLIVVSAENNAYLAWQCKLFHFSCVNRLKQTPVIVVHETGAPELHQDYQEIIKVGGSVLRAESYRLSARGDSYACRNIPGSLLRAAQDFDTRCEFMVLCDPDMIFARLIQFPETLTGDVCTYVDFSQEFVETARSALDISRAAVDQQKDSLRCGGPYVIPADVARTLGQTWLEAVDAFWPRSWVDVMYAFGLAAVKLNLKVELTHLAQNNYWPDAPLEMGIVHYCYGDATWNKRHYWPEQTRSVWQPAVDAPAGTVLGEILTQLREAEKFYSGFPLAE